ncbi:hypothetical protein M0813_28972 [Anaeramoeba flamelloides]|uniref:Uncharacterized protein n=1 Tax=Anaeramoeba flamelloides TaxID=1746091 RepID=A0ABQ8XTB5_9EUKA|nr:hypothetical protein M0813_28972 [Anaeramoeba flamelloides]
MSNDHLELEIKINKKTIKDSKMNLEKEESEQEKEKEKKKKEQERERERERKKEENEEEKTKNNQKKKELKPQDTNNKKHLKVQINENKKPNKSDPNSEKNKNILRLRPKTPRRLDSKQRKTIRILNQKIIEGEQKNTQLRSEISGFEKSIRNMNSSDVQMDQNKNFLTARKKQLQEILNLIKPTKKNFKRNEKQLSNNDNENQNQNGETSNPYDKKTKKLKNNRQQTNYPTNKRNEEDQDFFLEINYEINIETNKQLKEKYQKYNDLKESIQKKTIGLEQLDSNFLIKSKEFKKKLTQKQIEKEQLEKKVLKDQRDINLLDTRFGEVTGRNRELLYESEKLNKQLNAYTEKKERTQSQISNLFEQVTIIDEQNRAMDERVANLAKQLLLLDLQISAYVIDSQVFNVEFYSKKNKKSKPARIAFEKDIRSNILLIVKSEKKKKKPIIYFRDLIENVLDVGLDPNSEKNFFIKLIDNRVLYFSSKERKLIVKAINVNFAVNSKCQSLRNIQSMK